MEVSAPQSIPRVYVGAYEVQMLLELFTNYQPA